MAERFDVASSTHPARELAGALAATRLFAGMSPQNLQQVAAQAATRDVPAGQSLFRQGDTADSLYVVLSGRVDLAVEHGGDRQVVGSLAPGAVLGELALITHGTRSTSAVARRDSTLAQIPRASFTALLAEDPRFALALLELLGDKLSHTDTLRPLTSQPPRVVSFLAAGPASAARLPHLLAQVAAEAAATVRATVLDDPGDGDGHRARVLDAAEAGHDLVVAGAADPNGEWGRFLRRQADRTILVADLDADHPAAASDQDPTDLLVIGRQLSAAAGWQKQAQPRARYLVSDDTDQPGVGRMVRRLLGRSVAVVLSGGGARGLAHLGVLAGLAESGVTVDRVGGTSMGAFVAAMAASGLSPQQMIQVCEQELVRRNPFRDLAVPRAALMKGRAAQAMLGRVFGTVNIEELAVDYFCVSADLISAEPVVHRAGPVADAVAASMAVPGWMPPVRAGQRLLVDGGLLDNLPVDVAVGSGEGPVIGVDVMGRFSAHDEDRLPRLLDTLTRAITLGSWRWNALHRDSAALVITPELTGIGLTDFQQLDAAVDAGRQAALDAIHDHGPEFSR